MSKSVLEADSCVRLYNAAGEHKLSLVPCAEDGDGNVCVVDLCAPDGKVLYCGVDIDLANEIALHLGVEPIEKQQNTSESLSHSLAVGACIPADASVAAAPNFQLAGPVVALRKAMLEDSLNNVEKHILKTFSDMSENCPVQANTKRIIEDE